MASSVMTLYPGDIIASGPRPVSGRQKLEIGSQSGSQALVR
ncbi:hypothetical protein [Bradyrhizobium sp. AZCC 2230]